MSRPPKYQKVLELLLRLVEQSKPGDRLPSIRSMMADYNVSQSPVERSLNELTRRGLVRRERGRGIFVEGSSPKSKMLGVYLDGEMLDHSTDLFLEGIRNWAEPRGFIAADFGPRNVFENQDEILASLGNMGFAGLIVYLSSTSFFHLESNEWLNLFKKLDLPIVTCRPIPTVDADLVMPDYFTACQQLGTHLRLRNRHNDPIHFLGHLGTSSLIRLQGLRVGLGSDIQLETKLLDATKTNAYWEVRKRISDNWEGNLVIGVPPPEGGPIEALRGGPWRKGSKYELTVVLEKDNQVPPDIEAHIIRKPSYRLGEKVAETLIRRLHGYRGETTYEVVQQKVFLMGQEEPEYETVD